MTLFLPSILVTIAALALAFGWAGAGGLLACVLLVILEVGFSFDNAVVNATVLKDMTQKWQRRFLTWGMLITVFSVYYLCPILIVAIATGLSLFDVLSLALHAPERYAQHLESAHTSINAFGGSFLLMAVLNFLCDARKTRHWLGPIERQLRRLGALGAIEAAIVLSLLLLVQYFLPETERARALAAGIWGVLLYVVFQGVTLLCGGKAGHRAGLAGFLYLNLLDASFSLDAVIGAFAVSRDIVIIVLGLTAGGMFVRSLTLYLVRKQMLARYVFLEHGAYWGIGALAALMLASLVFPVPGAVAGLVGIAFTLMALRSSVRYNRTHR